MNYDKLEVLHSDDRMFKAWATVEVRDNQGEIVKIDDLEKSMLNYMDDFQNINLSHTNKKIGKVLNFGVEEKEGKKGIWIIGKILKSLKSCDEVWNGILTGKYTGLSIGAETDERINGEVIGANPYEISIVEKPANPLATIIAINNIAKSDTQNDTNINKENELTNEPINNGDTMTKEIKKEDMETNPKPDEQKPAEEPVKVPEQSAEPKPVEEEKPKETEKEEPTGPSNKEVFEAILQTNELVKKLIESISAKPSEPAQIPEIVKECKPDIEKSDIIKSETPTPSAVNPNDVEATLPEKVSDALKIARGEMNFDIKKALKSN